MRKPLYLVFLLAAVVGAHGQGRVQFANTYTTHITNGLNGPLISGAGNYLFGLYLGVLGTPENALTLNILATNTSIGRLSGGNPAPLAAPFADGSNYPLVFQIRGWSVQGGRSYEEAALAAESDPKILLGRSILGQVTPTATPNAA